jgi:adenine-specific DNA-methyltransferase
MAVSAQPPSRQGESAGYLASQIITCIGNKRALLPFLGTGVDMVKRTLGKDRISFFDAFSGSGIVSRYMKRHASRIVANDLERYSEVANRCYLTNRSSIDEKEFDGVFRRWTDHVRAHLSPGTISRLYAPRDDADIQPGERAFYTRENAMILDSARDALDKVVPEKYFDLLLAPLLAEASVHVNTSGVFKGFYKNRRGIGAFGGEGRNALPRILGTIRLQKPVLSDFDCESIVLRGDANEVARRIEPVDLAYFDPPYNQHPYGSNYFMLNLLAENRPPTRISAASGIPAGWNRSRYNRRQEAEEALFELLGATPARFLMVSCNSEGFIRKDRLLGFLGGLGRVTPLETAYRAFRGSRNLRRRPLTVTEYLFLVERTGSEPDNRGGSNA